MADVHDVAAYILEREGAMTTWKLQKLVYYAQAWHLVWSERPLFPESIEAWAHGPVVRDLYEKHRRFYNVASWRWGEPSHLTDDERESIDAVLDFYGDKTGHWLRELTHREPPWIGARAGLSDGERGNREIKRSAMAEYYGSL